MPFQSEHTYLKESGRPSFGLLHLLAIVLISCYSPPLSGQEEVDYFTGESPVRRYDDAIYMTINDFFYDINRIDPSPYELKLNSDGSLVLRQFKTKYRDLPAILIHNCNIYVGNKLTSRKVYLPLQGEPHMRYAYVSSITKMNLNQGDMLMEFTLIVLERKTKYLYLHKPGEFFTFLKDYPDLLSKWNSASKLSPEFFNEIMMEVNKRNLKN